MSWIQAEGIHFFRTEDGQVDATPVIEDIVAEFFPTAPAYEGPRHVTIIYIGGDMTAKMKGAIRETAVCMMNNASGIMNARPRLGNTNPKALIWDIQAPLLSEYFRVLYTALKAHQIPVKHTLQDGVRFHYGFAPHITLAEFESEEEATAAWESCDKQALSERLSAFTNVDLTEFKVYDQNEVPVEI